MAYKDIAKKKAHYNEYNRMMYHWYKDNHICVKCKSEDAVTGRTMCPDCAEKVSSHARAYYNKNKQRCKDSVSARRKRLINNKRCRTCGDAVCDNSTIYCAYHLELSRKNLTEYRRNHGIISRDTAKARGICIRCMKNRAMTNNTLCTECMAVTKHNFMKIQPLGAVAAKQLHWNDGI